MRIFLAIIDLFAGLSYAGEYLWLQGVYSLRPMMFFSARPEWGHVSIYVFLKGL
jgi:hypothetical protein